MNKIEQLIEKYTELHKAEQMVESGEVLNDLQSLKDTTEEREDICLRCGVEHKEVKREGSGGCSSRGHNYPRHIWK